MGGFEYAFFEKPERVTKLIKVLTNFYEWMLSRDGFKYDYTGVAGTFSYYETVDESFPLAYDFDTKQSQPLSSIFEVDEIEKMKGGLWYCHWREITWLYRWDESEISKLIELSKRNDCMWFVEKMFKDGEETCGKIFGGLSDMMEKYGGKIKTIGVPNDKSLR